MVRVICTVWMSDIAVSGCLSGWAYLIMGLMYGMYARVTFYLDYPNVVVRAQRTLNSA